MHRVHASTRCALPSITARTFWRLGNVRLLVLLFAWLTLFPTSGRLPQMLHFQAMLPNSLGRGRGPQKTSALHPYQISTQNPSSVGLGLRLRRSARPERNPLAPSVVKRSRGVAHYRPRLRAFSATLGLNGNGIR